MAKPIKSYAWRTFLVLLPIVLLFLPIFVIDEIVRRIAGACDRCQTALLKWSRKPEWRDEIDG